MLETKCRSYVRAESSHNCCSLSSLTFFLKQKPCNFIPLNLPSIYSKKKYSIIFLPVKSFRSQKDTTTIKIRIHVSVSTTKMFPLYGLQHTGKLPRELAYMQQCVQRWTNRLPPTFKSWRLPLYCEQWKKSLACRSEHWINP